MRMTLHEIKALQEEFDKGHKGNIPFYEDIDENNVEALEHLVVCLVGEVGEFANVLKKCKRGDYPLSDKKRELDEELTDIFIYLIKISNQLKVDLEKNFLDKLEKNRLKFQKYEI
jgi:NTP pyrophosphatase (non-canonical NTP hydrolase)